MIRQLHKQDLDSIKRLLGSSIQFPEALSVIEGNNPGWVFAGDSANPGTALVWAKGAEGFYLIGQENNSAFLNDLDPFIDKVITPRAHKLGLDWFEVSGSQRWNAVIERVFEKRALESSVQLVYTLDAVQYEPTSIPERGCEIRRVDSDLIHNVFLRNKDFLHSKIALFWKHVDTFLKIGLGYVLLCQDEIVSICCSGFVAGNVHAIDIETVEKHRKRGYARTVAQELIKACVKRKQKPYWDCMKENTPSARLAEKLGLTKSNEYVLYSFPLPKVTAHKVI